MKKIAPYCLSNRQTKKLTIIRILPIAGFTAKLHENASFLDKLLQELPRGKHDIQLYSLGTPNGKKVKLSYTYLLSTKFKIPP